MRNGNRNSNTQNSNDCIDGFDMLNKLFNKIYSFLCVENRIGYPNCISNMGIDISWW